jgi:short-subunit dehydrogenase
MLQKKVLITGASSGLGLSHAIYLTSKGFSVIGTSRKAEKLDLDQLKEVFLRDHTKFRYVDNTKTEVKPIKTLVPKEITENLDSYLEDIRFIAMDVTKTDSVKKAIYNLGLNFTNGIDVLINNAGNGYFGPIEEMSLEKSQYQFEVNFFGQIRMLQAILPSMRTRRDGQIINTASLAGLLSIPFQAHYSASKAAVIKLTESLRTELKPYKIKVSALLPGDHNTQFNVNTLMLHREKINLETTDIAKMIKKTPLSLNSPYYNRASAVWKTIVQNLIVNPPPILVSKKIEKIIKAKRPKACYKVGTRLQTHGITLLYRLFTYNMAIRIMSLIYGL